MLKDRAVVTQPLPLITPDAPQPRHEPRETSNAMRWIVNSVTHWRLLPHEFPSWATASHQTQRCGARPSVDRVPAPTATSGALERIS